MEKDDFGGRFVVHSKAGGRGRGDREHPKTTQERPKSPTRSTKTPQDRPRATQETQRDPKCHQKPATKNQNQQPPTTTNTQQPPTATDKEEQPATSKHHRQQQSLTTTNDDQEKAATNYHPPAPPGTSQLPQLFFKISVWLNRNLQLAAPICHRLEDGEDLSGQVAGNCKILGGDGLRGMAKMLQQKYA